MYVRLVLSPVADACRWSLLLLSPLLSITVGGTDAHGGWHLSALVLVATSGPSPGEVTAPCPAQAPPPNPIAAEPGDGRVLSRPSSRVHEPCTFTEAVALWPQTALTGSGSHRYSYGGFGGGHPHFHRHTADLRITRVSPCVAREFKACASFMFAGCCWWWSLAVDGGSGASRGHARNA